MPPHLMGPDFIAFIVSDLERSRAFWMDDIGLRTAAASPPGAHVFATQPVPFAIRSPYPGETAGTNGVALWFALKGDLDEYAASLTERNVATSPIRPSPFGRFFTFADPDGRDVTVHESK